MATNIPSLVFISDRPDESAEVKLTLIHSNEVLAGYWGFEQRSRRREKPRCIMTYTIRTDTASGICRRRASAEIELLAKVVFPIWVRPFQCTIVGDSVTGEGAELNLQYFRENGWVFIDLPDGSGKFYEIDHLSTTGNQFFLVDPPPAGSYRLYPAVIGEKENNTMGVEDSGLMAREEVVTLIER